MFPTPKATPTAQTAAASSIVIGSTQSDAMLQREYLFAELEKTKDRWDITPSRIRVKLRKQFKLDAPSSISDPQKFIDAIKKGNYKLDEKRIAKVKSRAEVFDDDDYTAEEISELQLDPFHYYTATEFIEFTDLPKADRKGYNAAIEAYEAAYQATKNIIMVKSPEDGLDALTALLNWTYKAPTKH